MDRPVIVGGGQRGVVLACCYVARMSGIRSAMPMFNALKACPEAVVVRPDMAKYPARRPRGARAHGDHHAPGAAAFHRRGVSRSLRQHERLHGGPPARTLALLARRIEREIGVTVSIGLAYNKFLAKLASDLDKPRGFAVIGQGEALDFLAPRPVGLLWGVGGRVAAAARAGRHHHHRRAARASRARSPSPATAPSGGASFASPAARTSVRWCRTRRPRALRRDHLRARPRGAGRARRGAAVPRPPARPASGGQRLRRRWRHA